MPENDKFTEPIRMGSTVGVLYMDKGMRKVLTLVAPSEAKPFQGKMSVLSPLCRAIMGRTRGDIVDLSAPGGRFRIQIMEVDNSGCLGEDVVAGYG